MRMKELEDLPWFPSVLRNDQTAFIGYVVNRFRLYRPFLRHLRSLSIPATLMVDLCSGSGAPAVRIFRESHRFTRLTLTDRFPAPWQSRDERVDYDQRRVDAREMPFTPGCCYTMFNALHHFSDAEKLQIVQRIKASGSHGLFVEILEPGPATMLKVLLTTTLGTLLFTPFIRPLSLRRLFFTYILPVNLITITYDGIVSVLKSRTADQYRSLFAEHGASVEVTRLTEGITPLIVVHIRPTP
jgi:ubiquinone/menaquinone biosynthesis C-methylase UbiE